MVKQKFPMTPAIRFLNAKKIAFTEHLYPYEEHGGAPHAAQCLGVPEHTAVKTLVLEADAKHPMLVLMHGDREVSLKQLARTLHVKQVAPCPPATAQKLTGYQVGGISPFGTRKSLPVYIESTIFALDGIYINGGKRGFLVEINPQDLRRAFPVQEVQVAITP